MSLGRSRRQSQLFDEVSEYCESALGESSIYTFLHRERERLFPDDLFADLFSHRGRRSIPPSVVAVVMVLQRLEGLSDYEASERFSFDVRWRFSAGVGGYFEEKLQGFDRTVLVQMRERLRRSSDPDRIFRVVLEAGKAAGLVGRKRVLDSTALYDSVSTMDTITLIRSAIRGVLESLPSELQQRVHDAFVSDDSYKTSAKPSIDWTDESARAALIDSRARDGYACLESLEGELLSDEQHQAVELLATILGQDLEEDEEGRHRIVRGVARDRVISTVDPETRHGHKTSSRSFDGYKGHIAVDPDSELITASEVTPGNSADGTVAETLIEDLPCEPDKDVPSEEKPQVYGDGSYGSARFHEELERRGIESYCKTPPASARSGFFTKDDFEIDLETSTIRCPNGVLAGIPAFRGQYTQVRFGDSCQGCPLRAQCTAADSGRSIRISKDELTLLTARQRQKTQAWQERYNRHRPVVERKIGHCMTRRHGGRRARVRGLLRITADFRLLAAAMNLKRLATLGLRSTANGWHLATA